MSINKKGKADISVAHDTRGSNRTRKITGATKRTPYLRSGVVDMHNDGVVKIEPNPERYKEV